MSAVATTIEWPGLGERLLIGRKVAFDPLSDVRQLPLKGGNHSTEALPCSQPRFPCFGSQNSLFDRVAKFVEMAHSAETS